MKLVFILSSGHIPEVACLSSLVHKVFVGNSLLQHAEWETSGTKVVISHTILL